MHSQLSPWYRYWHERVLPKADRPPQHWPTRGICYFLRHDEDGFFVQIWQHDWPRFSSASFERLCDAVHWRRLSIRAWDEELTLEEEAFVAQGRAAAPAIEYRTR
jgi:hypothetical protein